MTVNRWRVLVADDEPAARLGVRQLLAAFPGFTVAGECRTGTEVLAALDQAPPDLLFLDIQMPGLNGFDVLAHRGGRPMPVLVFLTAHDQFAVRAFEASALDYLLKPVSEARFAATMARVVRELERPRATRGSLTVATARGAAFVPIEEIDWIESSDNYARVWSGTRSYLLRESMEALEARIGRHGFVRAHRRALVAVERVREVAETKRDGLVAVLTGGARVPVSRRRRAAFRAAMRRQNG